MGGISDFSSYDFKSDFNQLNRASTFRVQDLEWVYFLQSLAPPFRIKIGKTHNLRQRIMLLQWGSPVPLAVVGAHIWPLNTESILHKCFKRLRSHGEWFYPGDNLVAFIEALGGEFVPSEHYAVLDFIASFSDEEFDKQQYFCQFYESQWLRAKAK